MAERGILLIVLIATVPHVASEAYNTDEIKDLCSMNSRINLTGNPLDPVTGHVVESGYVFPPESIWLEGKDTFGCACYTRPVCSPVYCPNGMDMYLQVDQDCTLDLYYWYDDEPNFSVYSTDVLNESIVVNNDNIKIESKYGMCYWMNRNLVSLKYPGNEFLIRPNGSIYKQQNNVSTMYNFDRYCLCGGIHFKNYEPHCNNDEDDFLESDVISKANPGHDRSWFNFYLNLLIVIGICVNLVPYSQ